MLLVSLDGILYSWEDSGGNVLALVRCNTAVGCRKMQHCYISNVYSGSTPCSWLASMASFTAGSTMGDLLAVIRCNTAIFLLCLLQAVPPCSWLASMAFLSLNGILYSWKDSGGNVLALVRCNTAIFLMCLLQAVPLLLLTSLFGILNSWADSGGIY